MSHSRPASEAVARVLLHARQITQARGDRRVGTSDLLCALWLDESRAAEILMQANVTAEGIAAHVGQVIWEVAGRSSASADVSDDEPSAEPAHSTTVAEAIKIAQTLAGQLGRHAELGTEHLLIGLVESDEEVAAWLNSRGITLDSLRRQVVDSQGLTDEPIAVEIALTPAIRITRETVRVDRILDAAANRCREGLRVVEDFVRFVLDDAHLSRLLKEQRHEFAAALDLLPFDRFLAARDTPGDVGTSIHTSAESYREHATDVVRANCKRVEESLRTLEEYSKTINPDAPRRFERLRYNFYSLEQAIVATLHSRDRLADCRLYLLVSDRSCPNGAGPLIRSVLAHGVDAVQLREKGIPDRRLIDLARRVREWTAEAGALFILNDRPDIAALVGADGVHVGQDDMTAREARQIVGADRLVGVSTHNIDQARQAVMGGADYLGVGPTFPSQTKEFSNFAGLDFIRDVAAEITRPWFSIGGINADNVAEVIEAGATRIAVSAAITSAPDPANAVKQLRTALASGGR